MNLFHRIFKCALWSAPIGVNIGLVTYIINEQQFALFSSPANFIRYLQKPLAVSLANVIVWALIGIIFGCSSLIFRIEHWSITKQTLVHFCTTYFSFILVTVLVGWFKLTQQTILIVTLQFIIIYFIIWSISMLRAQLIVKSLNKKLHQ